MVSRFYRSATRRIKGGWVFAGRCHPHDIHYIEKTAGHMPVSTFPTPRVCPRTPLRWARRYSHSHSPRIVESMIARGLTPSTAHTITSAERFRKARARTRLTRVAISKREMTKRQLRGHRFPFSAPAELSPHLKWASVI